MLFESTRILLRGIVQSIETGDDTGWDDRLESGIQCLYELHQMSRPTSRAYKTDSKSQGVTAAADRANLAIPYVKLMVSAIRRRDQPAALMAGKAGIVELNGTGGVKVVRTIEPIVKAEEAPKAEPQPHKPVPKHRPALAKPKRAGRASAASAR